jgi:hypothetical protein
VRRRSLGAGRDLDATARRREDREPAGDVDLRTVSVARDAESGVGRGYGVLPEAARDGLSVGAGRVEPRLSLLEREPRWLEDDDGVAAQEHGRPFARTNERPRPLARGDARPARERRPGERLRLSVGVLHDDLPRRELESRPEALRPSGRGRLREEEDQRDEQQRRDEPDEQHAAETDAFLGHEGFGGFVGHGSLNGKRGAGKVPDYDGPEEKRVSWGPSAPRSSANLKKPRS